MDIENMKNRLLLADDTIAILRSSNINLDKNLTALKADFSVLESLLIESGQTLQRLQEMYHKEKESNSVLTTSLKKSDSQNKELTELYQNEMIKNKELEAENKELKHEINKNKDSINTSYKEHSYNGKEHSQVPLQIADKKESNNEIALRFDVSSPPQIKNGHGSKSKMHMYHITIRDSLRDMAESLCDELVRVEEDMLALEPLLRLGQQEIIDAQPPSSSSSKYNNRAKNNRLKRTSGPDFIFGSPSSRLPVKSSEGVVDEEEGEDGDEGGAEGEEEEGSEQELSEQEGEEEGGGEEGVDEEKSEEEYEEGDDMYQHYDGTSEDEAQGGEGDEGEEGEEGLEREYGEEVVYGDGEYEEGEYEGEVGVEGEEEQGDGGEEEGEEGDGGDEGEYEELRDEEEHEQHLEEQEEQLYEGEVEEENQDYEDVDIDDPADPAEEEEAVMTAESPRFRRGSL